MSYQRDENLRGFYSEAMKTDRGWPGEKSIRMKSRDVVKVGRRRRVENSVLGKERACGTRKEQAAIKSGDFRPLSFRGFNVWLMARGVFTIPS